MGHETTGPGHFRITARTLDNWRTKAVCGRQLSEEEIEAIMPGSSGPKSPGKSPGGTGPDKNPPCPPNPPRT